MEDTGASVLFGQQRVETLGEVIEELITPIGDKRRKIGAVRQFEGQDRRGLVGAEALQLGHRPTLVSRSHGGHPSFRRTTPCPALSTTRVSMIDSCQGRPYAVR